jgi:hypothetical protein
MRGRKLWMSGCLSLMAGLAEAADVDAYKVSLIHSTGNVTGVRSEAYGDGDISTGLSALANNNYYANGIGVGVRVDVPFAYESYGYLAEIYGYDITKGISVYSESSFGNSYGLEVNAVADVDAYGIYSSASGNNNAYAGVFNGDVVVTGACNPCSPSDAKFKKNVKDYRGGLDKVMALRPKSYEMRADEFQASLRLAKGTQIGLIAQEVEGVLPEVVHDVKIPAPLSPAEKKKGTKKEPVSYKAMNYTELVPVMLQAIQEQQAQIEALKAQLASLK